MAYHMHSEGICKTQDSEFHCFRRKLRREAQLSQPVALPNSKPSIDGLGKHLKEADLLSQLSVLAAGTRRVVPSNEQR